MLLFNSTDGYPCHLILRVVDESTHESRMGILMILQEFMMRPENNQYSYEYIVNETSDLTLANKQQLEPANAYIPDYSVLNIIMAIFETADENWYVNNIEIANDYFVDQPYPPHILQLINLAFRKPVVHFIQDSICPQMRDVVLH